MIPPPVGWNRAPFLPLSGKYWKTGRFCASRWAVRRVVQKKFLGHRSWAHRSMANPLGQSRYRCDQSRSVRSRDRGFSKGSSRYHEDGLESGHQSASSLYPTCLGLVVCLLYPIDPFSLQYILTIPQLYGKSVSPIWSVWV